MSNNTPSSPPPPLEPTERIGSRDAASIIASSAPAIAPAIALAKVEADDAELRALEPDEIRARKRPRMLLLVWLFELVTAFFLAVPIQSWASHDWGAHPDGDAVLFRPGAHDLMSWLGSEGPGFTMVVRTTFTALILLGVFGNVITGAVVASLATGMGKQGRPPRFVRVMSAGMSAFFPLLLIGLLVLAIEGFVFGVGYFASSSLDHALEHRLGDAHSFTLRLVVLAVFVVVTLIVGVVGDLGRVIVARNSALGIDANVSTVKRVRAGIVGAIRTSRQFVGRASIAWGWRAALALVLIYIGSVAGDIVGERGDGALMMLFIVHQIIIFARAALRTSWLANALRLVRSS